MHAKSGLRFSIRDDIHGKYVRIWAKYVLKPRFYTGTPRGCVFRFPFFRPFAKTRFKKLIFLWGGVLTLPEFGGGDLGGKLFSSFEKENLIGSGDHVVVPWRQ